MADLAQLQISIEGAKGIVQDFDQIERKAKSVKKATDGIFGGTKQSATSRAMQSHQKQMQKVAESYQAADAKAQEYWNNIRKNASKVETDLKKLKQANVQAFDKEDMRLYRKELGSTETALRKLKGYIPDEQFDRLQKEISQSRRELNKFQRQSSSSVSTMSKLKTAAAGAGVAIAGMFAVRIGRDIARAGLELEKFQRTMEAVTGSTYEAQKEMSFIDETANTLGLSLDSLRKSYAGIAAASKDTSLEGEQTRDIFKAVAEASTALGLSADETQGSLRAISQMMSKGNVQAEELRGQLGERLPGAFQMAAKAMGVSTGELNKMLEKGEVLAEDLLPKLAKEMHRRFGKAAEDASSTAQAAFNRFENNLQRLKESFAESGFLDALADSADELSEIMRDPKFQAGVVTIAEGIGDMIAAIAKGIGAMGNFVGYMQDLNEEIRDFYDAQGGQPYLGRDLGYGQGNPNTDPQNLTRNAWAYTLDQVKKYTDEMVIASENARREVLKNMSEGSVENPFQLDEVVVKAKQAEKAVKDFAEVSTKVLTEAERERIDMLEGYQDEWANMIDDYKQLTMDQADYEIMLAEEKANKMRKIAQELGKDELAVERWLKEEKARIQESSADKAIKEAEKTTSEIDQLWTHALENIQDEFATQLYAKLENSLEDWNNDSICDKDEQGRCLDTDRQDSNDSRWQDDRPLQAAQAA